MTPLDVEILLHHHCSACQFPSYHSSGYAESLKRLMDLGAIEEHVKFEYRTTPLGAAWVKAICNTPIPRAVFIDQNGKVIE